MAAQTGMKRRISPYNRTCLIDTRPVDLEAAAVVGDANAGDAADDAVRAILLGSLQREPRILAVRPACRRAGRDPRSSISSTRRGMPAGSFCRSPSKVASDDGALRAASMPACMAAVWPWLRAKRRMRTWGPNFASGDPSRGSRETGLVGGAIIHNDKLPRAPGSRSARRTPSNIGLTLSCSRYIGMTTDRLGALAPSRFRRISR